MNKHLIVIALCIASLGFSVVYTQNEVEKDAISEAKIKMVQDLAQELEKKLADVTSEADLKTLIEETKECAFQIDETEKIFDAEFLKLAALGAAEGLVIPTALAIIGIMKKKGDDFLKTASQIALFTTPSGALSKSLVGKIGSLPKAKCSDFFTFSEVLRFLVSAGAQFGLCAFLINGYPLINVFISLPALTIATTTLAKRLEKRNAAIAHSNSN